MIICPAKKCCYITILLYQVTYVISGIDQVWELFHEEGDDVRMFEQNSVV